MRADAQALPFDDAVCDLVLAAQMLYHVPGEVREALREMRRVLRSGGRIVLVTGGFAEACLMALHREAARELRATPRGTPAARGSRSATSRSWRASSRARRRLYENALVFPDPAAVLRFYASGLVDGIRKRPPDSSHRTPVLAAVERRLREIFDRQEVLREPKTYGCFVAEV